MKNDGGPAFPAKNYIVPSDLEARHVHELGITQGMTLRDYFAAKAMPGAMQIEFTYGGKVIDIANVAKLAYEYADSMLEARDK